MVLFHLLAQIITKHRPFSTFYLKNQISISKTCYICGLYFHWGEYGNKNSIEYQQMGFSEHTGCVHLGAEKVQGGNCHEIKVFSK